VVPADERTGVGESRGAERERPLNTSRAASPALRAAQGPVLIVFEDAPLGRYDGRGLLDRSGCSESPT